MIIFVDDRNVDGPWDGRSEATAFRTVSDGLAAVTQSDQVWVWSKCHKMIKFEDWEAERMKSWQFRLACALDWLPCRIRLWIGRAS